MSADMKKRGLGRGLDALFREVGTEEETQPRRADEMVEAAKQLRAAPQRLAVTQLQPGRFQPRRDFREEALDQLAASIAAHGVLQPLLVRPIGGGKFEIIAGERRWRAAQMAKVHDLPVVVREMDDAAALEIALIENLQREDLTALEEAEGYQRLIDEFGHSQDQLAKQLGKSRPHVANTLRLLKLPIAVKSLIQAGQLSAGHARTLVGAENAADLAAVIVKRGLNVRQAERLAAQAASGKAPRKPGAKAVVRKDVDTLALEEKLAGLLGLKVSIDSTGGAGTIAIAFKTLDQLDDICERLSSVPGRQVN